MLEQARRGGLATRALAAFARLRARLMREAKEALSERERQVAQDAAAVLAADKVIVEAALRLPEAERTVIARLRAGIAAPLTGLKHLIRGREPSGSPDFVARLTDGRLFVVEYKGAHLVGAPDEREKTLLGALWARKTGHVFATVQRMLHGIDVAGQLRNALAAASR